MKRLARRNDLHLKRKLWHILTGLIALALTFILGFDSHTAAFASFSIGLAGLIFEVIRLRNSRLNDFFISFASGVLRERERQRISGFTYYCFGVSLSFFLFPWEVAITSVLFLIFGDPMAATVGTLYGKRALAKGKSLEGSLACFITCFMIATVLCGVGFIPLSWFPFALLAGLSGALAEFLAFLDDNLTIPVISGLLLSQAMAVLL
jgi:dolichol kinase